MNNDGINDIIIQTVVQFSSPDDDDTNTYYYYAYVIYGVQGIRPDITINVDIDPTIGFSIFSTQSPSVFNYEVGGIGDFNGDGIDDIALSASNDVVIIFGTNGNSNNINLMDPNFSTLGVKIQGLTNPNIYVNKLIN